MDPTMSPKDPKKPNGNLKNIVLPLPPMPILRSVLWIAPPRGAIDPLAAQVADAMAPAGAAASALKTIEEKGLTDEVAKLSALIGRTPLDDVTRLLLSNAATYGAILSGLVDARFDLADPSGARERILRDLSAEDGRKATFLGRVTEQVFRKRDIDLGEDMKKYVVRRLLASPPAIATGALTSAVLAVYEGTVASGRLPAYVEWYLQQQKIPPSRITQALRDGMTEYLLGLDLPFDEDPSTHKYDQFLALAFEHARARAAGESDPIDVMRTRGAVARWDYTVDLFEGVEEQGIVRENILAAGALDYVFWLGDFMGIFKIVKAMVLRWGSGLLDVTDAKATSQLYRYYKMLDERTTDEERAMLYKRVLNRGEAPLTSQMVVNTAFPALWHRLMNDVAEYIRKSEETAGGMEQVSPTPIYQAARDLQYNLSDHMTGLALIQVQELYAQLQEAIAILRNDDVLDQFGLGRRKNLWTVVERVAREQFGTSLNVASLRTLAVEGNRVFRWLADFDGSQALRSELDFSADPVDTRTLNALLTPAEAWIIAQADVEGTLGEEEPSAAPAPGFRDAAPAPERKGADDDFADWNV